MLLLCLVRLKRSWAVTVQFSLPVSGVIADGKERYVHLGGVPGEKQAGLPGGTRPSEAEELRCFWGLVLHCRGTVDQKSLNLTWSVTRCPEVLSQQEARAVCVYLGQQCLFALGEPWGWSPPECWICEGVTRGGAFSGNSYQLSCTSLELMLARCQTRKQGCLPEHFRGKGAGEMDQWVQWEKKCKNLKEEKTNWW